MVTVIRKKDGCEKNLFNWNKKIIKQKENMVINCIIKLLIHLHGQVFITKNNNYAHIADKN